MRLAQFIEFLKDRAGGSLRAVAWYRGEDRELVHLRDDLDVDRVQDRAEQILQSRRWATDTLESPPEGDLGNLLSTVILHEQAVLIHLPVEEDAGVVVGLEVEIARDLTEFVRRCRTVLSDFDPPDG